MRNNDVKKCFGEAVRYWRNQLGISQEELAERANLHRTYVSDVERGQRNVSLESIERIAIGLEIATATLFNSNGDDSRPAGPAKGVRKSELVDILFVEDNEDDADLAIQSLKRANMANRIRRVRDGAEALDFLFCEGEFARRNPDQQPQIILLDLNLPKVHGLEVLRRIKSHPQTRSIPVVVLTMSNRGRDIAESRRLGAGAYLVKPVCFENFSEVVPGLNLQWAVLKQAPGLSA